MFDIDVKQIEKSTELDETIESTGKLVICAGRWGPMCIPVYSVMEQLDGEAKYGDVEFRVINFDAEAATRIRNLSECRNFRGLPFMVYFRDGSVVHATSSIQTRRQIEKNIKKYLK